MLDFVGRHLSAINDHPLQQRGGMADDGERHKAAAIGDDIRHDGAVELHPSAARPARSAVARLHLAVEQHEVGELNDQVVFAVATARGAVERARLCRRHEEADERRALVQFGVAHVLVVGEQRRLEQAHADELPVVSYYVRHAHTVDGRPADVRLSPRLHCTTIRDDALVGNNAI